MWWTIRTLARALDVSEQCVKRRLQRLGITPAHYETGYYQVHQFQRGYYTLETLNKLKKEADVEWERLQDETC